jgi:hypothetical protein
MPGRTGTALGRRTHIRDQRRSAVICAGAAAVRRREHSASAVPRVFGGSEFQERIVTELRAECAVSTQPLGGGRGRRPGPRRTRMVASVRVNAWHGLTSQFAYTYGHAIDGASLVRGWQLNSLITAFTGLPFSDRRKEFQRHLRGPGPGGPGGRSVRRGERERYATHRHLRPRLNH